MSKVLVWKSDADGKLFEDRTKYIKHLKKLAAARMIERKIQRMHDMRTSIVTQLGECESFDDMTQFIKDNWEWFVNNNSSTSPRRVKRKVELVDLKFVSMHWHPHMRNSSACPIGGVRNWQATSANGLPTGYPGFNGYIVFSLKAGLNMSASYCFNDTTIHTGSGGGNYDKNGILRYSFDVSLFADDFPGLVRMREHQNLINILSK